MVTERTVSSSFPMQPNLMDFVAKMDVAKTYLEAL
jgi:hypothetical protein